MLNFYQKYISTPLKITFGGGCRFQPTCSQYAKEAFKKHGLFKGAFLSLSRLIKCNPFGKSGYDPVP